MKTPSFKGDRALEGEDEVNLLEIFGVLWGGKRWLIGGAILGLFLAGVNVMLSDPIYRADGLLQLEQKQGSTALPTEMQDILGEASAATTEIDILRSRMVIGAVVDEMNLDIMAEPKRLPVIGKLPRKLGLPDPGWGFLHSFAWSDERIVVGELAVPAEWVGVEMILTALDEGRYSIALPDGTQREGQLRVPLTDGSIGLSLRVDELTSQPGREFRVMRMVRLGVIQSIRERFSVTESSAKSSILSASLTDENRGRAIRVLDALFQAYVAQNISRSSAEAQRSLEFIEEQLPTSEQAVTDAQAALNEYRQKQQSVDLNYETQSLLDRATEIENQLNALKLQEEDLKTRFTINHPTYQTLLKNRAQLEEQLAGLRDTAGDLPETQKEIFNLTRNLDVAQQVYLQLLNRAQELRVVRASSIGSVRIIDVAQAGQDPIAPRKLVIGVIGTLAGFLIGAAIVFLRHITRKGVQGGEDLERMGLPVFATISFSDSAADHRKSKGAMPIIAITKPDDLVVEALRSLRTSLHFGMLDAKTNSVMLTSAAPGAGKSFNAVNLAVVAAQAGQKVCLVDADLRRGYLRRYFRVERNAAGLADHLSGDKTLDEVLRAGPVEGLSFITTGRYPPNPSELLMRPSFAAMLDDLNKRFDLIVIDSPPTLAVTDPVIMSRSVGASIMVVRHMQTALGEVEAVRRAFETAGTKIAGAILNGYRASAAGHYGSQHYYYNYRYSYKSGEK